jgi:hypothetical protein
MLPTDTTAMAPEEDTLARLVVVLQEWLSRLRSRAGDDTISVWNHKKLNRLVVCFNFHSSSGVHWSTTGLSIEVADLSVQMFSWMTSCVCSNFLSLPLK